ncbi:RHS repeat domain-containing protein [Corallococcus aberystwythensis]|uniref:Insecticide toxin TcdB middle/N-terminal domain-containing protein n=1 Tax=Corallococcus aberystwythensis TaxID=2316722 RepID=A0A3A8QY27_9BACT|nr:RHS repeat-associated core domain-containing protein [Corallococcus aberystwythensis]RKH73676.1 hypothetical protein D7W81_03210 [Corallococcus aberystwythensis]
MISRSWLGMAMGLALALWPGMGAAQLAPTGGHYGGRVSDTGTEPGMVNASGGFSASVPLDLPPARGGVPLPLSIVSGARGVGAVGLGWDIPFSYVRRDTSFARRKPYTSPMTPPKGREQVLLSLQGQVLELVPQGTRWVARRDAPEVSLLEQSGTWVMYDGQGQTWTFVEPAELAGTGFWLLDTIRGPGNSVVKLDYAVGTPSWASADNRDYGNGVSVDLVRVRYNPHPQEGCYKHEVTLAYGAPQPLPLALSVMGDRVLARLRTLDSVAVGSRATCASALTPLRTYAFKYSPDADTQQPRLGSVRMTGRQGTPEASVPVPVASFTYGSATTNGKLLFAKTQSLPMPTGADATVIASTARDSAFFPPFASSLGSTTWQSLTDVTGDGRPELVFKKDNKLWVASNRPGAGGSTTLGATTAQLADVTFASGAFEHRSATQNRFNHNASNVNVDKVWRQALDMNGDGRVDVVDAAEAPGKWVVYLNTPGTGPSGVKWARREINTADVYATLRSRGLDVRDDYVPLSSRFTGYNRTLGYCWRFNGTTGTWDAYLQGFQAGECGQNWPNQVLESNEVTLTEWELQDVNGDGFPDLVFNSSPVAMVEAPKPSTQGAQPGQVINVSHKVFIRPTQQEGNTVEAVLNVQGLRMSTSLSRAFSTPITILSGTSCGVGSWASSGNFQGVGCGFADVNGDGLLDRVSSGIAMLGTGRGFASVWIKMPGFNTQFSNYERDCITPEPDAPGSTPFVAGLQNTMRDVTGDGILDYLGPSTVAVGTGTGFTAPVPIETTGINFLMSNARERCDGTRSGTFEGLYDLDGDGRAEIVKLNGTNLDVYPLVGGSLPGKPEAGRIVTVDNGYGALTTVGYRSAKEDTLTKHQVPFPEIVVTSVETTGTQGLGGTLSATRYAYGGAELVYDSALQAFTLAGYQRSISTRSTALAPPAQQGFYAQLIYNGFATVTDTYPLPAPFATTKAERFLRQGLAGRVRDITQLTVQNTDPWPLLSVDVANDSRRVNATHVEWDAKLFEETRRPNINLHDCIDMIAPLDFDVSLEDSETSATAFDLCSAHGFLYTKSSGTWRGTAAPPSTANVGTGAEVRAVDDYGRVLNVLYRGDVNRSDDDLCVETVYATPVGTAARRLDAPRSRRYWYCDKTPYVTYAAESWLYDGLPAGSVSEGRNTSRTRDRYNVITGTYLDSVRVNDATYNPVTGNPVTVTTEREDGALRVSSLTYDAFGLMPVTQRVDATGLPALVTTTTLDPVSLAPVSVLDQNQTRSGTDYDGYGRPVRATVTPPGGSLGVLMTTSYLGFSGTDPLGRRMAARIFSDPVTPGTEASAPATTATVFLDELGRERRTEVPLGTDYANEVMITGARVYDGLGRVRFQADPYPASQAGATAYGTTSFFLADGMPSCTVRARGIQAAVGATDETAERYLACTTRTFANSQETVSTQDPSSLLPGSPQADVVRTATMTALGRLVSRSTLKAGVRLEHAVFTQDRLGRPTGMTRYLDPAALTGPVGWTWSFDSFGQLLQWQEPEGAVQTLRHSSWGEPVEVSWSDTTVLPIAAHRLLNTYDALGRIKHQEELTNGQVVPDSKHDYFYDVGLSPTSMVTPTNVLGRLAKVSSPTGSAYYSYDAYGHTNARTYIDSAGFTYVEKSRVRADGSLTALGFYLPDTDYAYEEVGYAYDTASRLRTVTTDTGKQLYSAQTIDPFGRVRLAKFGEVVEYAAQFSDLGRRVLGETRISTPQGARRTVYTAYDPMGREKGREELTDSATSGPATVHTYDALGRLASSKRTWGIKTQMNWTFGYDPLGNVLRQNDVSGTLDAALSYRAANRDRVCNIEYSTATPAATACKVLHDALGSVVQMPTRTGTRQLGYYPSGALRSITELTGDATFRYGALGEMQELDLRGVSAVDARHEWHLGGTLERREQVVNGQPVSLITRNIPGPGGIVASRRGPGQDWVFGFGEQRGARHYTDRNGAFVQAVSYQPFGAASSTGSASPGSTLYTSTQWNDGQALAAFGLVSLGARVYDPVIGRFLSRDPLVVPRTAATTNPYAFAHNDPQNASDPTGMDPGCIGRECQGPGGGGGFPGGGPSEINDPRIYLPSQTQSGGGGPAPSPRAASRPPPTPGAVFSATLSGPKTVLGRTMMLEAMAVSGLVFTDGSFNYDTFAATGAPLSALIDALANTQEGAKAIESSLNATYDKIASASAGFGDGFAWFIPTRTIRNAMGYSVNENTGYYSGGSAVGFVGSLLLPAPTSIAGTSRAVRAARAEVQAEVTSVAIQVRAGACARNCGYTAIAFESTMSGAPMMPLARGPMSTTLVQAYFETNLVAQSSKKALISTVEGWGSGARGIVVGTLKSDANVAHAFNVVNVGGEAFFVDVFVSHLGQKALSRRMSSQYSLLEVLRTF